MRTIALALVLAACGPKVAVQPSPFEEDDPRAGAPLESGDRVDVVQWDTRPVAPKGAGLRTGTIDRTHLLAVLDAGPGQFLRQFEVTSAMDGNDFVGWQLVQLLDEQSALRDLDLAQGDILIALNGSPLSRPDQLMKAWDALRTADTLTCDLLRGAMKFQLTFTIDPPAGRVPPDLVQPAPAPVPAPPATVQPTPAPAPAPAKVPTKK
jgi:hypothetical protein